MTDRNTEDRLATLEKVCLRQAGQIEALGIALSAAVAQLRGTDPCELQTVLVKQLGTLADAHTPLPDEHHTAGFHDTLTSVAGNLKADLEEN